MGVGPESAKVRVAPTTPGTSRLFLELGRRTLPSKSITARNPDHEKPDLDLGLPAWLVGIVGKADLIDAPAVAEFSSDRPDCPGGADPGTDRSVLGRQHRRLRSPSCGCDLPRRGCDPRSNQQSA